MNWNDVLPQVFELVIFPILSVLGILICVLIGNVIKKLKDKSNNDYIDKYLDMLDKTITECVISTTQTYVESLKKQGAFDADAQKQALQKTYDNVMKILTDEAKEYLQVAVADFETYVLNKIEAEVKITKSIQ